MDSGGWRRSSLTWWQEADLESCRNLSRSDINRLGIPGFKWVEGSGLGSQAKRLVLSSVDTLGGTSKHLQDHPVPGGWGNEWGLFLPNRDAVPSTVWEHTVLMPSAAFFYEHLYTAASDMVNAVPQGGILLTS